MIIFRDMKARLSLLWLALTVPIATSVSACSSEEVRKERVRQVLSQEDADLLGHEIFDLVDQAASYQSSHGGRRPRSLRHMGVDSLTSTTARWIETRNATLRIVVAFRRLSGHAVSRCSGDDSVLEQLSLQGAFRLECALVDGTKIELTARGPSS